jgi:D-3-phosphoglycerate dehydrogenase / 2-oxoglutarate reductase
MKNKYFIIDFDSTLIQLETLEHLAAIALENHPEKDTLVSQIHEITNLGMEGTIPFEESLSRRMKLIKANKTHVQKTTQLITKSITPSFLNNIDFFRNNKDNIYVISGSFRECMFPVTRRFGLDDKHVLANTFIYDKDGNVTGVDFSNPLSHKFGKAIAVAGLRLTGIIYVIGDSYTDFEIKQNGVGDYFAAYIENVYRPKVIRFADYVVKSFDEFLKIIK